MPADRGLSSRKTTTNKGNEKASAEGLHREAAEVKSSGNDSKRACKWAASGFSPVPVNSGPSINTGSTSRSKKRRRITSRLSTACFFWAARSLKWHLGRTLDDHLLCDGKRSDALMVLYDFESPGASERQNTSMMNTENSVL